MLKKITSAKVILFSILNFFESINDSSLGVLIYVVCINVLGRNITDLGFSHSVSNIGFLLFSYLSGYLGDKLTQRISFLISSTGCVLSYISLLILIYFQLGSFIYFVVALFVLSFMETLFQTSVTTSLPSIVPNESALPFANALIQITTSLGTILGPILFSLFVTAGYLLLAIGVVLLVNLSKFIIIYIVFSRDPNPKIEKINLKIDAQTVKNSKRMRPFIDSLLYILRSSPLRLILISTMLVNMGYGFLNVIITPFMTDNLGIDESLAITISSFVGIGAIVGSILAPVLLRKSEKTAYLLGILTPTIFLSLFFLNNLSFMMVCFIMILISSSRSIGAVIRVTKQQISIDKHIIGIVVGTMMTLTWGINPLASFFSGYLSDLFGLKFVIILSVLIIFISNIPMYFLSKKSKTVI